MPVPSTTETASTSTPGAVASVVRIEPSRSSARSALDRMITGWAPDSQPSAT